MVQNSFQVRDGLFGSIMAEVGKSELAAGGTVFSLELEISLGTFVVFLSLLQA
jgi:hypothetical protein